MRYSLVFLFSAIFFFPNASWSSSLLNCNPEEMAVKSLTLGHLKEALKLKPQFPTLYAEKTYSEFYHGHSEKFTDPAEVIWYSWAKLYERSHQKTIAQQGIFTIHALEDIMGAMDCYLDWNKLEGVKKDDYATFHARISPKDFVFNYARDILSHRLIVAGSLLASHPDPTQCSLKTFGACGFILRIPPQNLCATSPKDAGSEVIYQKPDFYLDLESRNNLVKDLSHLMTVDQLAHFPHAGFYRPDQKTTSFELNEIVFTPLTYEKKGEEVTFHKVEIVGVFINQKGTSCGHDYGLFERSKKWIPYIQNFAKTFKLPVFKIIKGVFKELSPVDLMPKYLLLYKHLEKTAIVWMDDYFYFKGALITPTGTGPFNKPFVDLKKWSDEERAKHYSLLIIRAAQQMPFLLSEKEYSLYKAKFSK